MSDTSLPPPVEDCLTLSVYAPKGAAYAARMSGAAFRSMPVMLLLHSGHIAAGSGSQSLLNASLLAAEQGVVVVVPNYRLGPLGYLAHPALSDSQAGTSGNYGMRDQSMALQWAVKNAKSFGGDPGRITLWGLGEGASQAGLHLSMASSLGRFRSLLLESGAAQVLPPAGIETGRGPYYSRAAGSPQLGSPRSLADAEAAGRTFAQLAGCGRQGNPAGELSCLRLMGADEVQGIAAQHPSILQDLGPVADGLVLALD